MAISSSVRSGQVFLTRNLLGVGTKEEPPTLPLPRENKSTGLTSIDYTAMNTFEWWRRNITGFSMLFLCDQVVLFVENCPNNYY